MNFNLYESYVNSSYFIKDSGLLPSFLPQVSFTKLMELLSHIITMFLNQLDVKSGNQMEKHRKLWKKLAWGRKGAGFVFLLHTRTMIIA